MVVWQVTAPTVQQNDAGEAVVPPASPASDEFVITDAPMPDHTASDDDDLTSRSDDRTEKLLGMARARKPRTERPERPKRERKTVATPRGGFTKPLMEMYGTIALAMMPFDPQCAMAVMEAAPKCAESLDSLAKQNDAVKRVLVMLTQTSAWGAVLAAHAPIILAITVHHVPAVKNSPLAAMINNAQSEASAA